MVKRIFYFGLVLVIGITITFVACSDENNVKNEQNDLNSDILTARQKSFEQTVAKIKKMYPETAKVETRFNQINVRKDKLNIGNVVVGIPFLFTVKRNNIKSIS